MNAAVKRLTVIAALLLGMIVGSYLLLSRPRRVYGDPTGDVPLVMPEQIGPYKGEKLFFCHNENCGAAFLEHQLPPGQPQEIKCPVCKKGDVVASITIGEVRILPKDTTIFRRVYKSGVGPEIQTTFVFTGLNRKSIHRPQVCLTANGYKITNEYSYDVNVGENKIVKTRVLEIERTFKNPQTGPNTVRYVYIYWFFSPDRVTNSHLKRFFYMSYDSAVLNYQPKWAYFSMYLERGDDRPNSWKAAVNDFLPRIYPIIEKLRSDLRMRREVGIIR